MIIRKALEIDVDEIAEIEKNTFTLPWNKKEILQDLNNPIATYFVAVEDNKVVGYIGYWLVVGEASITSLAVREEYRQKGVAKTLLEKVLLTLKNNSAEFILLEVRVSNTIAQKLYTNFGFVEIAIRKNYYELPKEDAIVMKFKFLKEHTKYA
ncbi:ribosomal-protein-alanine N-acetyltransferase [Candidatus Epulonipiscioides gigas]|nr:ribosomal-protein-alanine N-acetyltransferase [Epulopiscium sp. SCG-C07WGA-EpuloA2]